MTYDTNDVTVDLAMMDEDFLAVEPAEKKGTSNAVPAGTYQATIEELYFDRTKDGTKILLKWELCIAVGPYQGERLTRNNLVETPDNKRWLKTDLETAGLHTENLRLSEIPAQLGALLGTLLEVSVKRAGEGDLERTNVYVNRRVDRGESAPAPAPRRTPPKAPAQTSHPTTGGASRGLSRF